MNEMWANLLKSRAPDAGSDDEYCSRGYITERHHYIAHSVEAPPIRFVDRCQLCGHISSRSLRRQLAEGATNARPSVIF